MKHKLTNSLLSENYYNKYQGYRKHLKGLDVIAFAKVFRNYIDFNKHYLRVLYFTLCSCNTLHIIYTLFTAMDIFYRKFISKQMAELDEESIRRLFK